MKNLGQFVLGIDNSKGWTICPPFLLCIHYKTCSVSTVRNSERFSKQL